MDCKPRVQKIMDAMSRGQVAPLFDAMAEDVTWRWMGVSQWSKAFDGKQVTIEKLFGGESETLSPSSSVEVRCIHADGDSVVVEHSGRNELPDGRRYDNNYCWVLRFKDGSIQEVREYMDTQLVTETFGADLDSWRSLPSRGVLRVPVGEGRARTDTPNDVPARLAPRSTPREREQYPGRVQSPQDTHRGTSRACQARRLPQPRWSWSDGTKSRCRRNGAKILSRVQDE